MSNIRAAQRFEISPGSQIGRGDVSWRWSPSSCRHDHAIIAELCGELDLPCRTNGTFRARGA